jgi:hypothetical protein
VVGNPTSKPDIAIPISKSEIPASSGSMALRLTTFAKRGARPAWNKAGQK